MSTRHRAAAADAGDQLTLTGVILKKQADSYFAQGIVDGSQFSVGNSVTFEKSDTITIAIAAIGKHRRSKAFWR